MLFPDDVYVTTGERLTSGRVPPPTVVALEVLVPVIGKRVARALERQVRWCEIWESLSGGG